jgi:hypothetical protein
MVGMVEWRECQTEWLNAEWQEWWNGQMAAEWRNGRMAEWQEWWNGGMGQWHMKQSSTKGYEDELQAHFNSII